MDGRRVLIKYKRGGKYAEGIGINVKNRISGWDFEIEIIRVKNKPFGARDGPMGHGVQFGDINIDRNQNHTQNRLNLLFPNGNQ